MHPGERGEASSGGAPYRGLHRGRLESEDEGGAARTGFRQLCCAGDSLLWRRGAYSPAKNWRLRCNLLRTAAPPAESVTLLPGPQYQQFSQLYFGLRAPSRLLRLTGSTTLAGVIDASDRSHQAAGCQTRRCAVRAVTAGPMGHAREKPIPISVESLTCRDQECDKVGGSHTNADEAGKADPA